ncbi:hypothetical protein QQS21_006786 [Conoideocrella luteorostrata]|uniref:NACHT domain-containing protein n=1 Tax=Conoideocrella luteorostrata TaxID=1105319 RepID=A0AAJ0FSM9_9HYPO|nr:hypothetical protein QQS21_006786 [Conoideocrella luteorostrata]
MGADFDVTHPGMTACFVILTFAATYYWSNKKSNVREAEPGTTLGDYPSSRGDHADPALSVKPTKDYITCRIRGVPLDWNEDDLGKCIGTDAHVKSLATEIDGRSRTGTATFPKDYPRRIPIDASLGKYLTVDGDFLGITILYTPDCPKIDVIAVSGLGGHAFGSFKERDGDYMWLLDSLPYDLVDSKTELPMARIMIYGYNSQVVASHSMQELEDISISFRDSILNLAASSRPTILIGHSLGGLVLKKALVSLLSSTPKNRTEYECLARAVRGIVFLGVPHDGMDIDALRRVVGGNLNYSLIESLGSKNSTVLTDLRRDFNKLLDLHTKVETFCFYETEDSPTLQQDQSGRPAMDGPRAILVTKASATHCRATEYDSQHQSAIARSHSEMVKFRRHDHEYAKVKAKLQLIAQRVLVAEETLSPEAKACIADLYVTDPHEDKEKLKNKKGDRAAGTCEWILGTEILTAWLGADQEGLSDNQTHSNVLWLHGNPGTGKSMLAIFLTDALLSKFSATNHKTLAYFFCDSAFDTQNTATSVVRGLLLQLIQLHPTLVRYILPKYNERKARLFESFEALWTLFISAAVDTDTGCKYCIIDALDECDYESRQTLLKQLQRTFLKESAPKNIRILITSRPRPDIRNQLIEFASADLASFPGLKNDIDRFIDEKVAKLPGYADKTKGQVAKILGDKAGGTFLWVGIACDELVKLPSRKAISHLMAMPKGLRSLYKRLLDDALEHETTHDEIQRILSFVAVSLRPFSLLELSEACQIHSDEKDTEARIQFLRDCIDSCRLMVIVQDEKVLLLHQSIKDYLLETTERTKFRELEAHADLAYRCVDYLIEHIDDKKHTQDYLLDYATNEWANHARLAQRSFKVKPLQAEFFKVDSLRRESWLASIRRSEPFYSKTPEQFSILHVAAKWGIPALVEHVFDSLNRFNKPEELMHVMDSSGAMPLEHAAKNKHSSVMRVLLDLGAVIDLSVMLAAAGNEHNGMESMTLLLKNRGDQIKIPDKVVEAVARNPSSGKEVMALLLQQRGDQVNITDKAVEAAARNPSSGKEVMALLLQQRGDQVNITDKVVEAAAENPRSGKEVMALLLQQRGDQVNITDRVVKAAARNPWSGKELIALLLQQRGDQVNITDKVVEAAAWNPWSGKEVMALLLQQRGDQVNITDKVVEAAAWNPSSGKEVMALLLQQRGDQVNITDKVLKAAAWNPWSGKEVIDLLLQQRGDQVNITDEVVEAAAGNIGGKEVIDLLLQQRGDQVNITDKVVEAAAGNRDSGKEVIDLLLQQRGDQVNITDKVVEAAAGNIGGKEVIDLLLQQRGDQVHITDKVVEAAAGNSRGKEVMALLLQQRGDQVNITDKVVEAAAGNSRGKEVMALLLQQRGDQVNITDEVVEAAAGNRDSGKEVMALLLQQRGDQVNITDKVMEAAAGNRESGKEIIALLLKQRGDQVHITDKVVEAAAGNWEGKEIMALLLEQRGDQINITDKVVEAAAGNWKSSEEIMALLLQQRGDQVHITDKVVEAAAGNWKSGDEIMALLLQHRGDQVNITDKVVEAAAGNWKSGDEIMALILQHRGDQVNITDMVLKATAGY